MKILDKNIISQYYDEEINKIFVTYWGDGEVVKVPCKKSLNLNAIIKVESLDKKDNPKCGDVACIFKDNLTVYVNVTEIELHKLNSIIVNRVDNVDVDMKIWRTETLDRSAKKWIWLEHKMPSIDHFTWCAGLIIGLGISLWLSDFFTNGEFGDFGLLPLAFLGFVSLITIVCVGLFLIEAIIAIRGLRHL